MKWLFITTKNVFKWLLDTLKATKMLHLEHICLEEKSKQLRGTIALLK